MGLVTNILTLGKEGELKEQIEEHAKRRGELITNRDLFREAQGSMAPGMSDLGAAKRLGIWGFGY